MYYRIKSDIYSDYGIVADPVLPDGVDFISGAIIADGALDTPLRFRTNCDEEHPPRDYFARTIPVLSSALLEVFLTCGVDNFQKFPATLSDPQEQTSWDGHFAVNVLGLLSVAVLNSSEYVKVGEHPSGMILSGFQKLVIDAARARDLDMFRLAESPSELLISERIVNRLKATSPPRGWGITVLEVEEA